MVECSKAMKASDFMNISRCRPLNCIFYFYNLLEFHSRWLWNLVKKLLKSGSDIYPDLEIIDSPQSEKLLWVVSSVLLLMCYKVICCQNTQLHSAPRVVGGCRSLGEWKCCLCCKGHRASLTTHIVLASSWKRSSIHVLALCALGGIRSSYLALRRFLPQTIDPLDLQILEWGNDILNIVILLMAWLSIHSC